MWFRACKERAAAVCLCLWLRRGWNGEVLRQGEGQQGAPCYHHFLFLVLSCRGFESYNKQSFLANFGLFSLNVKHLIFKYFLVLFFLPAYFDPSSSLLGSCFLHQASCFCSARAQPLVNALHLGMSMCRMKKGRKGESEEGIMQGSQSVGNVR